MSDISNNLQALRRAIDAACTRGHRAPGDARLVAVSKGVAAERLAEAAAAGQGCFGESYLQEALAKIARTEALAGHPLEWHFIGPLQANKTAAIAQAFSWVHGVDRERIARRLSDARDRTVAPLNVCVQVNVSGEASKSGCAPLEAAALCATIASLPNLRLRGLMAIPAPVEHAEQSRAAFHALRDLADSIRASGSVPANDFDTLSMGMSDDFEVAIEEGATLVRIGTALFGARAA